MIWTVALRGDGTYLNVHVGHTNHGKLRFYIEAPTFALAERVGMAEAERRRPKCSCGMPLPCRVCEPPATRSEPSERVAGERALALELLLEVQSEWLRGPKAGAFSKFLAERIDALKKPPRNVATPAVQAAAAVGLGGFVGTSLLVRSAPNEE